MSGPLDVARTLARYHLWGEDPTNRQADGVLRRAIRADYLLAGQRGETKATGGGT